MDVSVEATGRSFAQSLLDRYPMLDPAQSRHAVARAYRAVALFELLSDPDAAALWFACAEREVRLRLGVDVEDARLDPESHASRRRGGRWAAADARAR